jgi:hypothetical protein
MRMKALATTSGLIAAAMTLLLAAAPAHAESGSVRLTIAKAGFIVGVGGGSGTLVFHGHSYPLSIGGVSVGTIGAAKAELVGRAYNLRNAIDIAGTYTAVSGSIAVAGGIKGTQLKNSNGVVLKLQGRQAGFEASASLSGLSISMK